MLFSEAFNEVLSLAAGAGAGAVAGGLAAEGFAAGGGVGCVCNADGGVTELSPVVAEFWLEQPAASSTTAAPANRIFLFPFNKEEIFLFIILRLIIFIFTIYVSINSM
jgi:hypothetical protein